MAEMLFLNLKYPYQAKEVKKKLVTHVLFFREARVLFRGALCATDHNLNL